jgi:hypothetical protein
MMMSFEVGLDSLCGIFKFSLETVYMHVNTELYLDLCDCHARPLFCFNHFETNSKVNLIYVLELDMCVIIRLWKDMIVIKCILDKKMFQQIYNVGSRNLKKKSEGRKHRVSLCTPTICGSTQDHFWQEGSINIQIVCWGLWVV